MRLYRYVSRRGGVGPRTAVAGGGSKRVDLIDAWTDSYGSDIDVEDHGFLTSMLRLIEEGPEVWSAVRAVAEQTAAGLPSIDSDPDNRLLCPFDRLASLRDFLAFEDHVELGAKRRGTDVPEYWYEAPVYYKGNHRALLGPGDEIEWPPYSSRVDFELELAMVIGRRGREVPAQDAGDHIFGFTVFNDLSARDVQAREMGAWLGPAKGKDFANAFGPCIVTADEVGPEPDLEMTCRVNGEEWGRSRSSGMRWTWADMIAHVSHGEDVYPGDVYGSGTPGGCCGLDLGRDLSPGDVVELEIERIGILRNVIGAPA